MESNEELSLWVDNYYKKLIKKLNISEGVDFMFYKSLRGYFKHSIILTDIKEQEFKYVDYRIWDRILTNIKSSHEPSVSGGLFFRYEDYKDFCSLRSFYRTKKKYLDLKLLIETPFKDYYILNPLYVIKLYNPK